MPVAENVVLWRTSSPSPVTAVLALAEPHQRWSSSARALTLGRRLGRPAKTLERCVTLMAIAAFSVIYTPGDCTAVPIPQGGAYSPHHVLR
jgi:hypothetical protein